MGDAFDKLSPERRDGLICFAALEAVVESLQSGAATDPTIEGRKSAKVLNEGSQQVVDRARPGQIITLMWATAWLAGVALGLAIGVAL